MSRLIVALLVSSSCLISPLEAADLQSPRPQQPALNAAGAGIWGAIAYSAGDTKHGFTWGADQPDEARDEALKHCENAGGRACRVVAQFRNHRHWDDDDRSGFPYFPCAALTRNAVGQAWGAASAETRAAAETKALLICNKGGSGCEVSEWVCT